MSKDLNLDQDLRSVGRSVGPDLGPNCLQRLSADDKSTLVKKELMIVSMISNVYSFICSWADRNSRLTSLLVCIILYR